MALFQSFLATAMCTWRSEVRITSRVLRAHETGAAFSEGSGVSKQRRSCSSHRFRGSEGNAWAAFSRTYPNCIGLSVLHSIDEPCFKRLYIIFKLSEAFCGDDKIPCLTRLTTYCEDGNCLAWFAYRSMSGEVALSWPNFGMVFIGIRCTWDRFRGPFVVYS